MKNKLNHFWKRPIDINIKPGSESRVFGTICIITVTCLLSMMMVYFFTNQYSMSLLSLASSMIIIILYGIFRRTKNQNKAEILAYEKANKELLKSLGQKNKIIALISHDLKNPLISITRILEMIKEEELSVEETKLAQEHLYVMAANTQKMAESILEWATVELKSPEPNFRVTDIIAACEHILNIYHSLAKQKGINFTSSFSGNPHITTDIDRLSLILRNLLQNAIKFTPKNGSINFLFENNGKELAFKITDTGIGMTEEKVQALFHMDLKPTAGTSAEKGYGFGLFISQENTKKIGGHLSAASKLGIGSTFELILPVSPKT